MVDWFFLVLIVDKEGRLEREVFNIFFKIELFDYFGWFVDWVYVIFFYVKLVLI